MTCSTVEGGTALTGMANGSKDYYCIDGGIASFGLSERVILKHTDVFQKDGKKNPAMFRRYLFFLNFHAGVFSTSILF